jgi:hypothetical protein
MSRSQTLTRRCRKPLVSVAESATAPLLCRSVNRRQPGLAQSDSPFTTRALTQLAPTSHACKQITVQGMNTARYGDLPAMFGGQLDVPPDLVGGVVATAAGFMHSMALLADGSVRVWGGDADGTQVRRVSCASLYRCCVRHAPGCDVLRTSGAARPSTSTTGLLLSNHAFPAHR